VIFGRRNDDDDYDDEEEEELELVLFQGAINGIEANLAENARLVQAALVRAKELVSEGLARRAEMIRVETKGNVSVSTFFVDGVPYPAGRMQAKEAMAITQMLKLLAGLDIKERTKPQSGGIKSEYLERKLNILINTQPIKGGAERLIVRVIDPNHKLEKPEEIGISDSLRETVKKIALNKEGLILAAGPPMSGTSTTAIGIMRCVDAYMLSIYDLRKTSGTNDNALYTDFKWTET